MMAPFRHISDQSCYFSISSVFSVREFEVKATLTETWEWRATSFRPVYPHTQEPLPTLSESEQQRTFS